MGRIHFTTPFALGLLLSGRYASLTLDELRPVLTDAMREFEVLEGDSEGRDVGIPGGGRLVFSAEDRRFCVTHAVEHVDTRIES